MAYEDFTDYVEEDPNNRFTVTSNKIDISGLQADENAYVYKDKGVDHFDGDFEHLLETYIESGDTGGSVNSWVLANVVAERDGANENMLFLVSYRYTDSSIRLYLMELDGSSASYEIYTGSLLTSYYLKIKRDESAGDYGTLYCYVYDDAERTNLVDTLTVALHTSKKDFRYIYGAQSHNHSDSSAITGYTQNLDLQEVTGAPGAMSTNTGYWGPTI